MVDKLLRHLGLGTRHLQAGREVGGGMVDRVLDVLARHLDLEANAILGELLDLRLHPPYLSRAGTAHRSAGERTRTSKGLRPMGPKPIAYTSSATPAQLHCAASSRRTRSPDVYRAGR